MTVRVLVLGLGNVLLQDEGLGVHALRRLIDDYVVPGDVHLLDGGTLGLDLLPELYETTHLLILDAVDVRQAPGTCVRLAGRDIPAQLVHKLSLHQVGLQELMAAASLRGVLPAMCVLHCMQPAHLAWSTELSPVVAAHLDHLVAAATRELVSWGLVLHRRSAQERDDLL